MIWTYDSTSKSSIHTDLTTGKIICMCVCMWTHPRSQFLFNCPKCGHHGVEWLSFEILSVYKLGIRIDRYSSQQKNRYSKITYS